MSGRRRSRERSLDKNPKLRMDNKPQAPRFSGKFADPSVPASRRREIDNVMKKARARGSSPSSNAYWDKKLLEVEAKDPNRWRHSGYKSLYLDASGSVPSGYQRSRSRSPVNRRSPAFRRSPRSPPSRGGGGRGSPINRRKPHSHSPPMLRSPMNYRSPGRRMSPAAGSSNARGGRLPRPRSPPPTKSTGCRRSRSGSSISSCSDDSCSVCSPKHSRKGRSRSRSFSVPRRQAGGNREPPKMSKSKPRPPPSPPNRQRRPPTPPRRMPQRANDSDKPTDPRRQPPPPRPRGRGGEIIDVSGVKPPPPKPMKKDLHQQQPVLLTRIKKEGIGKKRRSGSPSGDSSGSDESSILSPVKHHIVATTSLTLSDRFGKIAQWSADRERREMENMRITKTGGDLKVMIEEDDFLYGTPPRRYSLSPVPDGHYPEDLMAGGGPRSAGWDDVRIRYQYYKDLGYLRDLSLDDYVKWEEWWYKYQDWLANERHYEHWMATHNNQGGGGGGGRRRGRKRLPPSQRLN